MCGLLHQDVPITPLLRDAIYGRTRQLSGADGGYFATEGRFPLRCHRHIDFSTSRAHQAAFNTQSLHLAGVGIFTLPDRARPRPKGKKRR